MNATKTNEHSNVTTFVCALMERDRYRAGRDSYEIFTVNPQNHLGVSFHESLANNSPNQQV